MAGKRRKRQTSRKLTPEQLEKMKLGREKKKVHAKRMEELKPLEHRLAIGSRQR